MLYNECQVASGCTTLLSGNLLHPRSVTLLCVKRHRLLCEVDTFFMCVVPFGAGMIKWTLDISA